MGDVLGKECEKEETLSGSVEDVLGEEAEGAASSCAGSESDSDKDLSGDSDEDLSWLLPMNTMDLGARKCKCEGCLKLFESYNSDKKNAKLLLSSWKEFRNYIRDVYMKSPFEFTQKNESASMKNNEKLHEIVQVMRLCDPYQLFQKIEDELCSMVLESRIRQLNLLKDETNPALAEEFITGLIAEYVKLLTSALQLSPTMESLLGPQLQKFGLTWEVLNKQLYRSLVYNHFDVQQNLVRFIEQLRKMLPFKDDIYHELVHQYLALDREMTLIGTMWKNVEPLIQEYRNLKSKENEKLSNLLDAMKDFFANKLCTTDDDLDEIQDKNSYSASDDVVQYCPNCMTRRDCPCEDCSVAHMMSCEDILLGFESPLGITTPSRSRSRSPIKQSDGKEGLTEEDGEEQQSCECHACTLPPSDLMDCSMAFDHSRTNNGTHGDGFQLYPHIHGTSKAQNSSDLFGNLHKNADILYHHLYNVQYQSNSNNADNQVQMSNPIQNQLMQSPVSNINSSQSNTTAPSSHTPSAPSEEVTELTIAAGQSPTPGQETSMTCEVDSTAEKLSSVKKSVEQVHVCENPKENNDKNSSIDLNIPDHKSKDHNNGAVPKEKETKPEKSPAEKDDAGKSQGNAKGNGCVISGICGKCCIKHGTNCLKKQGCRKGTEKNSAGSNTGIKPPVRCVGGKDDRGHRIARSHLCGKSKSQDGSKKNKSADDSSSHEDSCSESPNSTSVNTQRDPRHCDCCYCEVFGHGVPSVAPVSRNYQEMRERLRLRLNMKKSAKCKTAQNASNGQTTQEVSAGNAKSQSKTGGTQNLHDMDLVTLLKYIEGEKKDGDKNSKKAAKKARQKRKQKEKEKEKQKEEEVEKKRTEAVKNHVPINITARSQNVKVNSQPSKKAAQQQQQQPQHQPQSQPQPPQKYPQSLNLSGLRSLAEKSDLNSAPKMVTIRRVMAPFSAEPTVTITLKGSTPDKDKVLFMLKNGSETVPPELCEPSKKSKKKKKGENQKCQEEYEPVYQPPVDQSSSKKKKKKKKQIEEEEEEQEEAVIVQRESTAQTKQNKKSKKGQSDSPTNQNSTSGKKTTQKEITAKSNSGKNCSSATNSKSGSQKNVSGSKTSQNESSTNNSKQKNKNNSDTVQKSVQSNNKNAKKNVNSNSNSGSKNNDNGGNNKNSNQISGKTSGGKTNEINGKNAGGVQKSVQKSNNSKSQANNSTQMQKGGKGAQAKSVSASGVSEKQGKKQKKAVGQEAVVKPIQKQKGKNTSQTTSSNNSNNKSKESQNQKSQRNSNLDILEKLQNKHRLPNLEISRADVNGKFNKKNRSDNLPVNDVEVNWSGCETGKIVINTPSYRLSEVLSSIAPSPPPKEEINLENLRLPPGITITKIEGPVVKPIKPPVQPSQIPKPAPPIVMSTPILKPNPPPGNVIVVDTGRLKEVIKENSQVSSGSTTSSKNKKKKNKQQTENASPLMEMPISQFGTKVPKNCSQLNKGPMSVMSGMDTRKMVPNLENQQATIIKTSNNMVTIRSPALQQAMNIHAYQNSQAYKSGMNGYASMNIFNDEVTRINEKMRNMKLAGEADDRLTRQMRSLNLSGVNRVDVTTQTHSSMSCQTDDEVSKKKKKKKKKKGKSKDDREVEPVESVFQPKDIDLENGDIDDDERELEAFKRFCFQSVPPERKNKVKVNLNIKDIVLKKKSSGVGCS
ncbi:hypothetical protein RUM44_000935 [Polyplax serrata]|uniref:FAM193 C-terminal domain-containing protein n=1 Tax=Polyplax serrata TaxID=468196 RepID=A0ABR1B7D8_POLSC